MSTECVEWDANKREKERERGERERERERERELISMTRPHAYIEDKDNNTL